jgi:hypothetical protein
MWGAKLAELSMTKCDLQQDLYEMTKVLAINANIEGMNNSYSRVYYGCHTLSRQLYSMATNYEAVYG